jgi:MOSC domain-containing protein YiiM
MFHGKLIGIYVTPRKGKELQTLDEVEAIQGRGLVGDRYFLKEGTYSDREGPDREVTLIEVEALDGLAREYGITLLPEQSRRNLLTRSVPLNHLVDRTFAIGTVVLRGIRLCEPCGHLEALTCKGARAGLIHRGGLRAQIVQGGLLQVGAEVTVHEPATST